MSKDELIDKFSHDFRNVTLSERGLRSLLKAFMGELEERYVLVSHVRYNMLRGLEQKWEYKKDEISEDKWRPKVMWKEGQVRIYPKTMQETDKPMQKVTTIADTDDQYWAERQEIAEKRIAERKKENKISRVAEMLQEFMKQANSVEYWQGERSGRGWVRGWARRIVEVQ